MAFNAATHLQMRENQRSSLRTRSITVALQIGLHVTAIALTAIGVTQAIARNTHPLVAIGLSITFLIAYFSGALIAQNMKLRIQPAIWFAVLSAIWVAMLIISPGFIWLSFLLWLLAGHLFKLMPALVAGLGVVIAVIAAQQGHRQSLDFASVVDPIFGLGFTLAIARGYLRLLRDANEHECLIASLQDANRELAELQDELAASQRNAGIIAERTRLSRDIHDTIAQSLAGIQLLAHNATRQQTAIDRETTLQQIEELSRNALSDVRSIVADLAPTQLNRALVEAVGRIVKQFSDETSIATQLHVDDDFPTLSTNIEVCLLRTLQSALANVRQHSAATTVAISLEMSGDSIRLDVVDNGTGFDLNNPSSAASTQQGRTTPSFGIGFMRSRLSELGGGLEIESEPGSGTALSAHLPINTQPQLQLRQKVDPS